MLKRIKLSAFFTAVIFFASIFVSYGFSACTVSVINGNGKVLNCYYSAEDITSALSNALIYCKNNAAKNNPLTVKITCGTYSVSDTLYLSSYTTVDLNSSRLKNANRKRGNIFKSPEDKAYPRYSSLKFCTIKNGILDGNYNENRSCILRLCHAENITIENVIFLNNYYSHHCELAACKSVKFISCAFSGQISDLNVSSSEAIQLDILDRVHFYGFSSYDNTMNDKIVIKKCLFRNLYRGVGTHNYFKNLYQTNIEISSCNFENITDCAISAVNFKDVSFENNKYINCKYSSFCRDNGK